MGTENCLSSKPRSATALTVALVALAFGAFGTTHASAAPACPSFRVLHNDRIGAASFPAGSYAINVSPAGGLSCTAASKLFARFLEDYDGVLPAPWKIVSEGTGKASFAQRGATAFTVFRTGSGGNEESVSPLGALCKSTYTVNANQGVGPLFFRQGRYLLYIPARSGISCRRASVLFTRFLATPGGALPRPWAVKTQTATFFKPENPTRSAFRVEPLAGPNPAFAVSSTGATASREDSCTPPKVNGFTITSVRQHGIGCEHANAQALHTLHHGVPHGWTCTHRISGRNVSYSCHNIAHSSHTFSTSWNVH